MLFTRSDGDDKLKAWHRWRAASRTATRAAIKGPTEIDRYILMAGIFTYGSSRAT